MTDTSNRRDSIAQRCGFMREIVDQVVGLDDDSVLSNLGSSEREHLSNPRFSRRLAMRYAREIVPDGLFFENDDPREATILRGGGETVTSISAMAGAHVLWPGIIRIVRREDRESLDAELGIPTREIALRGRRHNLGSITIHDDSTQENAVVSDLVKRIRKEGALCWGCWLATRDPISARRLRVLTPARVSRFIMGGLPGTAEERGFRRLAVDLVIDELMTTTDTDVFEHGDS